VQAISNLFRGKNKGVSCNVISAQGRPTRLSHKNIYLLYLIGSSVAMVICVYAPVYIISVPTANINLYHLNLIPHL
jgi:hypothetical protein